jgi:hypothetical protein
MRDLIRSLSESPDQWVVVQPASKVADLLVKAHRGGLVMVTTPGVTVRPQVFKRKSAADKLVSKMHSKGSKSFRVVTFAEYKKMPVKVGKGFFNA